MERRIIGQMFVILDVEKFLMDEELLDLNWMAARNHLGGVKMGSGR
jgi:hypothetical protein